MTVIVYKHIRFLRRSYRSLFRFHWSFAVVWCCALALAGFFAVNLIYQVIRKPGEIFTPISGSLLKGPDSTWQSYRPLFEEHSTKIISSEFLAALAQIEGSGNPVALNDWRWQWSWNPFEIYRPASSALGMYQITDGTFAEARKYCIRDHEVASDGPWYEFDSCWFNSFYARTVPSHAVEMTAAYLHRAVEDILGPRPSAKIDRRQKENLAAVIHLCGRRTGAAFAARGFRIKPGERCGTHSLRRYLTDIDRMKKRFARLR